MKRAVVLTAFVLAWASPSLAEEEKEQDTGALFVSAVDALGKERPQDAIARFESLGDRGVVDAVVSYDRGLAYASRVHAGAGVPGDLGRAAHGFEEARDLTRDRALSADATAGLTAVRSEIARRRARAGDPIELDHGASMGRSIVNLLPENVWAIFAAIFSVALAAGIVLRARGGGPRARVAGTTVAAVSGLLLASGALVLYAARDARHNLSEGVVVGASSHLLDDHHVALAAVPPLPEGVRVRILESTPELVRVTFGAYEGWISAGDVLPLARR